MVACRVHYTYIDYKYYTLRDKVNAVIILRHRRDRLKMRLSRANSSTIAKDRKRISKAVDECAVSLSLELGSFVYESYGPNVLIPA